MMARSLIACGRHAPEATQGALVTESRGASLPPVPVPAGGRAADAPVAGKGVKAQKIGHHSRPLTFATCCLTRARRAPFLAGQMSPDYIWAVPTIDLPADELAAVTAAIRGVIAGDRYPHAPRLDPLRAALARFDAAAATSDRPQPD